jgi:hypothetical protein
MSIGRQVHAGACVLRLLVGAALVAATSSPSFASTAYGDLNNFDVFNDTGTECHGFEIELDDVHSVDVTYTYDWNHYGAPTISEDNADPLHPKVFVRYAAKYGAAGFAAFTAIPATAPSPTDGHMCTDPSVNFGCEHFGVGYYGTPSAVKYNWLIEDPLGPGTLIHGPAVNVATPTWTYLPPAPAQPVAQVQAVILAPPPPPAPIYEFGDAVWVKSIVTTSHNNGVVELKDLVSDDPADPNDVNWRNGEPDEVEIEWHILQTEFNNPNGANNELAGNAEDLPHGDEVVTRRYEFYKYTGPLDPETNEAKCDSYPPVSDPASPQYKAECDPSLGAIVGDYIGAQMAGFNVEAVLGLIDHVQDGDLGEPYVPRTVVVGGNTPYVTTVTAGALPPDLVLDATTGVLSGTPTTTGVFSFTVTATDADAVQVSKSYTLTIAGAVDLCAGVVCGAADACHQAGVCDPATGLCSDPPALDGSPCDDGNACTQTDSCQAGACIGGDAVACAAADQCHVAGTCDPGTGVCSEPPAADGSACNDGNACTQTDLCAAGVCSGGDPIVCAASDQCRVAGICNVATGICSDAPAPDGTACNDGDACTQTDTCQAGSCTGTGASPVCGSGDVKLQLRADKKVKLGQTIDYLLRIKNRGPDAATSAVATLTCTGTPFHVTTVSSGCTVGVGTVTCALGTLAPKQSAAIAVTLVADTPGLVTCTAEVSSATSDPVPTNQTKTGETTVR